MASTAFVDGSTLTAASWFNDVDSRVYNTLSSVAGTNTITGTGPVSMTAYAANQLFIITPANTTTGAPTINITPSGGAALGAKNIFFAGAAALGGELVANVPAMLFYDGTQFNIIGPSMGPWIAYTPALTANTGTWGTATVSLARFKKLSAKSYLVTLTISATVASGSPTQFILTLPDSISMNNANQTITCVISNNGGTQEIGLAQTGAANKIGFFRINNGVFAGACTVAATFPLEAA